MSFVKNISKHLSNNYSQKILDSAKKFGTDAIKTTSKRAIQKTAEVAGDLVGNKIADKIASVSKKSFKNTLKTNENEIEISKERYISTEKRLQIIYELRLI